MDFKSNKSNPQILEINNQISAKAIALYLKDHTFLSWQQMMEIWLNGYTQTKHTYNPNLNISIKPFPRPNGGFWGGGGHGSPSNYQTTIQFLVDSGLVTFSKVNGFKLFTSTRKLKNLSTYGLRSICITSKVPENFYTISK